MSNPQTGTQGVFNMVLPSAPMIVPQSIDLRSLTEVDVDLSQLVDNGTIDFISGAYVDNSANPVSLTIRVAGSNQLVTFSAGEQGYVPLLSPNQPKFFIETPTVAGVIVPIIFYNVPLLPYRWGADNSSNNGATISEGSITLDGTNQILVNAGEASKYFILQCATNNGVNINIAGGDSTVSGIFLNNGQFYESINGIKNAITISGTSGDVIIFFKGN